VVAGVRLNRHLVVGFGCDGHWQQVAVRQTPFTPSLFCSISFLFSIVVSRGNAGCRTRHDDGQSPAVGIPQPSTLSGSTPLSGGGKRVGVMVREKPPCSCPWSKRRGLRPLFDILILLFCELLGQSTNIPSPISNLVPHILPQIDDTTLYRLVDPKYVKVRFSKPRN